MRFSTILTTLGLAVSASAVDIRFMEDWSCRGWAIACANLQPGVCCFYGYDAGNPMYVLVTALPSTWQSNGQGFGDNQCISKATEWFGVPGQDLCMNTQKVHSAKYFLMNKKREEQGEVETPC
ncbi:hypothetical protein BU23DRAFT_573081 [Bimuria novae-zelandiae CBS 107.79]|uniref:Uncharacterized protein n=1 Tax=Bimuria novae-zelandiae CBS 107.79 TaxID=1447943 RepID=A0A6A5V2T2_9PLEO|nr:hypothetical protein BU23DRAFT_573081 [Bimuria novae-zelandiae CBS 107.79]